MLVIILRPLTPDRPTADRRPPTADHLCPDPHPLAGCGNGYGVRGGEARLPLAEARRVWRLYAGPALDLCRQAKEFFIENKNNFLNIYNLF